MEVKSRYKQTEVGVLPEEWNVVPISTLLASPIQNGVFNQPSRKGRGSKLINVIDLYGRFPVDTQRLERFDAHEDEMRRFRVRNGDIFFTRSSLTPDGIAKCNVYRAGAQEAVLFDCHIIRVRADRHRTDCFYLARYCTSPPARRYLIANAKTTTMTTIDQAVIANLPVALPPLAEQEAIASALSDADGLIESLEQLLAKKRHVKQGAMQQLLTSKKRLPGFSGEWDVKRLGDVGEVTGAGVDKKIRPDEVAVRLVNYLDVYRRGFIFSEDLNHWVTAPVHQATRCAVHRGDVFFTPSSETRDDIGVSAVAMEDIPDATYSYHVVRLRLREPWDLNYRAYAFKTRAFLSQAETLCDGNGTRYVVSLPKFRMMTVQVPPVPEQTAIATVLSDMDAEIAALESKLSKARQIKQGMMQELLTGRIRLV